MRKRLHILKEYLKWKKHIAYVEKRTLDLRNQICRQAVTFGNVDRTTRELFLKYNDYLKTLYNNKYF
jgi:hypothetical protein